MSDNAPVETLDPAVYFASLPRRPITPSHEAAVREAVTILEGGGRAVLVGPSGAGKTQAALECAYRLGRRRTWVLPAVNSAACTAALARVAGDPGLPQANALDHDEARDSVRRWLEHFPEGLLLFDGARPTAELARLLPGSGPALLTSEHGGWGGLATEVPCPPLPADEATELLVEQVGGLRSNDASDLVVALGGLPLALGLAAAHLREARMTFPRYLEALGGDAISHSAGPVVGVAMLAVARLRRTRPAIAGELGVAAFLETERIPPAFLPAEAVAVLARLGLLQVGPDIARLPPAVRQAARSLVAGNERRRRLAVAVRRLEAAFSEDSPRAACDEFVAHVEALAGDALGLGVEPGALGRLLDRAARYCGARGRLEESRRGFERALSTRPLGGDPGEPDRATLHDRLGCVARAQGDLQRARHEFELALEADRSSYGSCHPKVAVSLSNLAGALRSLGETTEARALLEEALAIHEAAASPLHPDLSALLNNLGSACAELGDLVAARRHLERALAIAQLSYGPDHQALVPVLRNLAACLGRLGQLRSACLHLERVATIDEAEHGLGDLLVGTALTDLARLELAAGELESADTHARRALDIAIAAYGSSHPNVAVARSNLASILIARGRLAEATSHLDQALLIARTSLGATHSVVAAIAWSAQGVRSRLN